MMKRILLPFLLLVAGASFGQTNLRAGGMVSYHKHKDYSFGGELVIDHRTASNFSYGLGINVLHFENVGEYTPAFVTGGYYINNFLIHADGGFLLFDKTVTTGNIKSNTRGDYYYGGGIRYDFLKNFYVNAQYAHYRTRTKLSYPDTKTFTNTPAVALSLGFRIKEK